MVARGGGRQSSANAGELDPQLAARVDIKQYYSGGLAYHNVEPVPQGGFRDMGGTVDNGPVRKRIAALAQSGVTPNLGPHTGTQTVWSATIDGTVAAVHLSGLGADTGEHSAVVEVFSGGSWVQIGPAIEISSTAKGRTLAFAPGAGKAATAVRVRVTFSVSATAAVGTVTVLAEGDTVDRPRYAHLRHDSGDHYFLSLQPGLLDIFLDDDFVAAVYLPEVTAEIYWTTNFYCENATIGIFQRDLETARVRRAGSAGEWAVDLWPYSGIPTADLGGDYAKIDDEWEIFLSWTSTASYIYISVTVDGETTTAVPVPRTGDGAPADIDPDTPDWALFATQLQTAIRALPSMTTGVTVSQEATYSGTHKLLITFGDDLAGNEYQVAASITNTAEAAALAYHVEIGKTEFEPLLSASRGWPGLAAYVQDRLGYADIKAEPSAIAVSRAADYFNINIEAAGANAARLDRLRGGQIAERVLALAESTFLLAFTNLNVYFAANRTISKTDVPNFTLTSNIGIVANTEPVELDGKIYYVGAPADDDEGGGHQVLSLAYDEIASRFTPNTESLLASHLVAQIIRSKRQKSERDTDASRKWMLREDGLVVVAQVIASQEILGYCRWRAAAGGVVREIDVDARNKVRLCVERGGALRHERIDRDLFLHAAIVSTSDLAGTVAGLDLHEGRTVYAVAEGYVLGPFTVSGGEIELGEAYSGDVLVGLFQPPRWESMPRYRILPNDEIVLRPGRIHTVFANVIDTTSIAVGANGQAPRNVVLARTTDPVDAPTPPATRKLTVAGLLGFKEGTTAVFTQTQPGRLRVRDIVFEEAL